MPEHASELYARNVSALLELMLDDDGALAPDFDDEVLAKSCVTASRSERTSWMDAGLLANLAILVLAGFVGFAVISKVPNTLHTPLMSGTNAIHGIVLLGGLIVLGHLEDRRPARQDPAGGRDRVRHDQRGRRVPGHRPDAGHVQGPAGQPERRTPADELAVRDAWTSWSRRSTSSRSRCSSTA